MMNARLVSGPMGVLAVYYIPGGIMWDERKEGLPMSRIGYAIAKETEVEEDPIPSKPEGIRVSPELDEVLHMLEALQRRRSNGNPQTG